MLTRSHAALYLSFTAGLLACASILSPVSGGEGCDCCGEYPDFSKVCFPGFLNAGQLAVGGCSGEGCTAEQTPEAAACEGTHDMEYFPAKCEQMEVEWGSGCIPDAVKVTVGIGGYSLNCVTDQYGLNCKCERTLVGLPEDETFCECAG
jgi:hypothetical protein